MRWYQILESLSIDERKVMFDSLGKLSTQELVGLYLELQNKTNDFSYNTESILSREENIQLQSQLNVIHSAMIDESVHKETAKMFDELYQYLNNTLTNP